jgi:hypothetical protein
VSGCCFFFLLLFFVAVVWWMVHNNNSVAMCRKMKRGGCGGGDSNWKQVTFMMMKVSFDFLAFCKQSVTRVAVVVVDASPQWLLNRPVTMCRSVDVDCWRKK